MVSSFRESVRFVSGWLRERSLTSVALLLLAGTGAWAFVELTDEVLEGETQAADVWMLRALRTPDAAADPLGPVWLSEAMRDLTALGSVAVLTLVIAAVAGYCLLAGDRPAMWTMLVAGTGGILLTSLLKELLGRTRPDVVPHLTEVSTASFPSGHSMVSAAVYLTLGVLLAQWVRGRRLKSYFVGVAVFVTLLVGVSRVYLGVHYPTDVLAGWTAGAVWAILCGLTARHVTALQKRPAE